MHHVIIGFGAAGRSALFQIRKFDPDSKITVVTDEADPFYLRPFLGQYLIDEDLPEAQSLGEDDARHLQGVDYRLGMRVMRVSPKENRVDLSDGSSLEYNYLLVAAGTRFWTQEFGLEAHLYTLKTKADALRLLREARKAESVLVYGGGYQALEIARIFHFKRKQVRWVAPPGFFWPRQLPYITAAEVKEKMAGLGLDLRVNRQITHAVDLDGKCYRVFQDDGESFDAGVIVVAPHEVPRIDFLVGSGVHLDNGVLVNEELRTNVPNVFAAGDCAQVWDLNSGQSVTNFGWKSASRQGLVAGENMAGHDSVIIPTKDEYVLDLMGKKLLERW
jgi:NADPH-dependent 2,4-dienoyl-CoA reductase/sulfur reductase-like enzyme